MYFDRDDINRTELPAQRLLEALDDDGDGLEDEGTYDAMVAGCCEEVDAILSSRYAVPFSGVIPLAVKVASKVRFLSKCYEKRGFVTEESNPHMRAWSDWAKRLTAIAQGNGQLEITVAKPSRPSGGIVSEPSRLRR